MASLILQFVKFAEREEGNTPYHRQYDFLIDRFASLSLTNNTTDADKYHEYVFVESGSQYSMQHRKCYNIICIKLTLRKLQYHIIVNRALE